MQIWTLTDIGSWFPILHYMNFADSAICANNCVLIKAEDTGKLTRILSYNTHTHSNMLKTATHNLWVHRVKVNVRCMQFSSFSSTKCGITGCNLGPKSYWRREEKKKKKLAAAVGSRQRCTAAENSQDADASKRFQTEAPLSVHCPCSALQMSSLKAGKCNTRRISIRSAKREVQPQCLTEWWMISLSQSCATHKRQIRLVKIFLYFSALQNSTSGAVHLG